MGDAGAVQVHRTDRITVRLDATTTVRHTNGWVDAWGVATRSGVLQYPEHGTAEYRSREEVFDEASLSSLRGVPLTIDHPEGLVTLADTRDKTHGWVLQVVPEPPLVRVQVRLASPEVLAAVRDGIVELSGGYLADFTEETGTDPDDGTPYTGVQRNIRYNHLALVEVARAGPRARLTFDGTRRTMATLKIGSSTYAVTAALAATIAALASTPAVGKLRTDAEIETSTVSIDGTELVLPKAMVDALLAGLGIGAPAEAAAEEMPAMDEGMEEKPLPPGAERLDAKTKAAIDAAVAQAIAQHRADSQHASAVERRATQILGQAPSAGDVYGVMVEAVARIDSDRKAAAELLAHRARKGDMRAAGQLEGMMDALGSVRTDAERTDAAANLGRDIDEARRADSGKAAPTSSIEDARAKARQRKIDAGKRTTAA